MYKLKTRPTDTDPLKVIAAIPNEKKQADAKALLELFKEATGKPPIIWGEKMIGFGSYKYKYATGHCGEIYATGFSVSKSKITLHLYLDESIRQSYLKNLGNFKASQSCVYVNKLADIDTAVLAEIIRVTVEYVQNAFEK